MKPEAAHQPPEACETCERKESTKLESIQMNLRTITSIAWMILGYLIMTKAHPTMSLWLMLPILCLQSLILSVLSPICERLLLHLWRSDSCDKSKRVALTPNIILVPQRMHGFVHS